MRKSENMRKKGAGSRRRVVADPERHIVANQPQHEGRETDYPVDEVNRDSICSDPHEGSGPGFPFPDIDDLMRDRQQDHAVAADDQRK